MSLYRIAIKRQVILLIVILQFIFGNCVFAIEEINTNDQGIMIQGYDVVSYFQGETPTLGSSDYQTIYNGGIYYFSSVENSNIFRGNAEKYTPAYGGYCAYGVRMGQKLAIDPLSWKLVNGTLYFQLNQGTQTIWGKDLEENIAIANQTWPEIRSRAVTK